MNTPPFDLDLTQSHFQRTYGNLTVFGTWFGKDRTPALAIVQTMLIGKPDVIPCIVPLASAFMWDERTGDGAHCARTSISFAESLGLNAYDVRSGLKVTHVIRDCLGDLLSMPVKPTERIVFGDAVITEENGKQHHAEIADHV